MNQRKRVLITGAAGRIGSMVREAQSPTKAPGNVCFQGTLRIAGS